MHSPQRGNACSLQPNSGAQGEYAGLMIIRAYHMARGEMAAADLSDLHRGLEQLGSRIVFVIVVETLIGIAESAASCELWGLLKRPDEKFVTERAYDNPRFVEDLVRGVAARLAADARFSAWSVEAENFESIHNHSAYALVERVK